MQRIIFILLLTALGAGLGPIDPAIAQLRHLSEEAQISMITVLPGDAPEELFGHSAIRVKDPVQDIDLSFNYGTFQFDSYFLPKFIYGDLNYFLSVVRFSHALEQYRQRRRPVIEQVLKLSPDQQQSLFDFLLVNAREENRYYRYDFLFDNCSTRIRDAMESVLGEDIRFAPEPDPGLSFRQLISLYLPHKPFLNFGIDLLLGSKVDRIAEPWETMFLPDYLMEAFDHASVRRTGERQPLVSSTEILLHIEDYDLGNNPPWAAFLTWTLFAVGALVTYFNYKNNKNVQRWFDIPLFAITGLVGLLIIFLWFISLHEVTANNLNLFWAWPTHLILAAILFRHINPGRKVTLYFIIAAVATLLIVPGSLLWPQYLHPAVLPVLLLLAMRSGWIAISQRYMVVQ